jgi:hypothetical protein
VRRARFVVLAAVAAALVAAPPADAGPGPQVLVYGDSLVYEAAPYALGVLEEVAGVPGVVIGRPGGAVCDLFDRMQADAARFRPRAVVLAFSGNALTRCMEDRQGNRLTGDAWLAKYRHDLLLAIAIFRRVPTVWLGTAPISWFAERDGTDDVHRLEALARELARAQRRVRVADAAAGVLDDGRWARTKPCLPNEPCTGGVDTQGRRVNLVRSPDTAHFCPVPYPTFDQCPVHASGGLRYALGLLAPALRATDLWRADRAAGSMAAGWE